MKNAVSGLLSRLDTDEERISELEYMSRKNFHNWKTKRKKSENNKCNRISKNCGTGIKGISYTCLDYQKEMKERNRSNIWNNNDRDFPKLMSDVKPQI